MCQQASSSPLFCKREKDSNSSHLPSMENPDIESDVNTPLVVKASPTERPSNGTHLPLSQAVKVAKSISPIALPMILTGLLLYSCSMISMLFLGRLGDLALAGGALAVGLANITSYSVLSGLAMGMEPICGQAFGAKLLSVLGITLQRTVQPLCSPEHGVRRHAAQQHVAQINEGLDWLEQALRQLIRERNRAIGLANIRGAPGILFICAVIKIIRRGFILLMRRQDIDPMFRFVSDMIAAALGCIEYGLLTYVLLGDMPWPVFVACILILVIPFKFIANQRIN